MRPGNDDAADSGQSRGARAKQNDQQRDGSPNAAAAQRARILAHLQAGRPLTTIQARRELDTLHPAARVMELRRAGWSISMAWVTEETGAGQRHRVGRYWLEVQP
ncbi:MAG: helix-turn-helix domain-containing protein [Betaproteobacteria bacterium]|nr:helix-turn-helix domain-containing protein [Betaproteobacteria bacterium]